MMTMNNRLLICFAALALCRGTAPAAGQPAGEAKTLADKTLVVWASPAGDGQTGGSALTLDDLKGGFDGIVFAEIKPKTWAPGSDNFNRAPKNKDPLPQETASPGRFVQVAIAYQGKTVTLYRNGEKVCDYQAEKMCSFSDPFAVVFGVRHIKPDNRNTFVGEIDDARIYDRALSQAEIREIAPNKITGLKPVAALLK